MAGALHTIQLDEFSMPSSAHPLSVSMFLHHIIEQNSLYSALGRMYHDLLDMFDCQTSTSACMPAKLVLVVLQISSW